MFCLEYFKFIQKKIRETKNKNPRKPCVQVRRDLKERVSDIITTLETNTSQVQRKAKGRQIKKARKDKNHNMNNTKT